MELFADDVKLCSFLLRDAMIALYMSSSLSVRPSQADVVSKRLNVEHHTIAHELWFSDAKDLGEIRTELTL